ncbi:hypothetical protein ACF1G0_26365, partial [Streptomyces sp. NPDC013953]
MRSARTLLAAVTVTAALTITAPSAYAFSAGDREKDDHSYSNNHESKKDEDKKDEDKYGKDHESKKDEYKKDEDKYGKDKPHGGVHTGGGLLSTVTGDDW